MADSISEVQELSEFLDFIFCNTEGWVYLAFKKPDSSSFQQQFFQWPQSKEEIITTILSERGSHEVFYAPALFKEPSAKKENVLGSHCFWVEFDGNVPPTTIGIPDPSCRIQSSTPDHAHWYWKATNFIEPNLLERGNRTLAYALGADISGWDAGQVLRPPNTLNHKRQRRVGLLFRDGSLVNPQFFEGYPEPPPPLDVPIPEALPRIEDVIARVTWPSKAWVLFKQGVPEGKRSDGLMALGYYLAELQLTTEEILAILINADERWGKFKGRNDQLKRLMEIVTRAKAKYPPKALDPTEKPEFESLGFKSLLATEVHLEWIWEGLLQKAGYLLLTGPSGVGKTQFSVDAAMHLALGRDFLENTVKSPMKIGFFSLEMGLGDLKYFLSHQATNFTPEELEILEQNFRIFPIGEPLYLNRDEEKERIERAIEKEGLRGIFVDSLGSTTEDELSRETDTKNLMDWLDRLRNRTGVFTWFVHHHRKATGDNKRPNKLSDVYGSQYITARATTVLALWNTGIPNTLDLLPLKIRLAPPLNSFYVYRDGTLHFTKKKSGISVQKPKLSPHEIAAEVDLTEEEQAVENNEETTVTKLGF